jgi:hypothetical protein
MNDLAFVDRLEFTSDITLYVLSDLRWLMGKLHIVELLLDMAPALLLRHHRAAEMSFLDGWRLGKGLPALEEPDPFDPAKGAGKDVYAEEALAPNNQPMSEETFARWQSPSRRCQEANDRFVKLFEPIRNTLARQFMTQWTAYGLFIRKHLHVEPELVLRAHCPPLAPQVQAAVMRYEGIESDVKAAVKLVEAMQTAWRNIQ